MARARPVELKLPCWKKDGDYYVADTAALEAEIAVGGLSQAAIATRMGHGYPLLAQALQGVRLNQYEAQHVETGIRDWPALLQPPDTVSGIPKHLRPGS